MAAPGPKFADLVPRLISGAALLAVAALGLWLGGMVLALLLSALGAVMLWEYFRLIVRLTRPFAMVATVGASVLLATSLILAHIYAPDLSETVAIIPATTALVVLALTMATVVAIVRKSKLETCFGAMIPAATFLFFFLHQSVPAAMWLVVVTVIATDVAGYVFGKLIGGPKFWPALSPNKTWSGTVSGWVMAVLIAVGAAWNSPTGGLIIGVLFLVLVSFAAQMADISESALKRRAGVKDSSNLLPGHGGVLDRFDGMLGGFTLAGLAFVLTGYAMMPG